MKFNKTKLGTIPQEKEICEAVVAIPYFSDDKGEIHLFEVPTITYSEAVSINSSQEEIFKSVYPRESDSDSLEVSNTYSDWENSVGNTAGQGLAYQLRMMDKYVIPPHFDFKRNKNVKPHIQYIFQFKMKLDSQDLADLWQNLYPENSTSASRTRKSKVFLDKTKNTDLDNEFVTSNINIFNSTTGKSSILYPEKFMNEKVRWIVFKAKYRGVFNYDEIISKTISESPIQYNSDSRGRFSTTHKGSNREYVFNNYGYNWPYDYFSIVEMIELSAKVDFIPGIAPSTKIIAKEKELPTYSIVESTSQSNKEQNSEPVQTVIKNYITAGSSTSSGEITQTTFTQTIKQNSDAAPSPATVLSIPIPQGYQIKSGSESIYINGMLQTLGASNDYTISGNTITFAFDIEASDAVVAKYTLSES